jgi:hypothetical protein
MVSQTTNGTQIDFPSPKTIALAIAGAAAAVAIIQIGAFLMITYMLKDWPERGQFGDLFGVTNSSFSGLAFAALIYTLFLQQKQIRLQSQELADQRAASIKDHDLSALTILLDHYNRRQDQLLVLEKRGRGPGNLDQQRVQTTQRILEISAMLDRLYGEITTRQEPS